jgi:hypothetical protein
MNFSEQMDALNNSSFFNASGLATVLSFFGLNAINIARWADINIILLVCIGAASLGFTLMKMYREWLETKRLKRQIREEEEAKKK